MQRTAQVKQPWIPALLSLLLGLTAEMGEAKTPPPATTQAVPLIDHIIVVVMENHSYDEVRFEAYTASLIAGNSSFSASYALTHPSQPNYIGMWAGLTLGVTNDNCPPTGAPYSAQNLGHACEAAGITWRAYSENLPSPGYSGCTSGGGLYVRKHDPWTHFSNLDHLNERPYTDLALDIAGNTLPRLAYVIPNQCNNTHDCPVSTGDAWLGNNLPAMIDAVGPNGLVILTWDEDDNHAANHILTVFAGPLVKVGYVATRTVNHYTVLRTITDALGISPFGAGIGQTPIDDVWNVPTAVGDATPRLLLSDLHPNPSRGAFEARFAAPSGTAVAASIFDAGGRQLRSLTVQQPGTLRWDGRAEDGTAVGAGVFFLRVRAGDERVTEKLLIIR